MNLSYWQRATIESREHIANAVQTWFDGDLVRAVHHVAEAISLAEYTFRPEVKPYLEGMLVAMMQANLDDLAALRDACDEVLCAEGRRAYV